MRELALTMLLSLSMSGCTGIIVDPPNGAPSPAGSIAPPAPAAPTVEVSPSRIRRLSASELDGTFEDLLGDDRHLADHYLGDGKAVFDPDYEVQMPSSALVESVEQMAFDAADHALTDPDRMATIVGCSVADEGEACVESFVRSFGRRALRRPLTEDEVSDYVGIYDQFAAAEGGGPTVALATVIAAFLEQPELLYHIEIGTPVPEEPGEVRLTSYEIASRMSFLLWGRAPDDALLDQAAAGNLDTAAGRRAVALEMLADDRARAQVEAFHAEWLGYDSIAHDADLAARMRRESDALVDRVIFDDPGSWMRLFTLRETYVDDTLAALYGMPTTGTDTPRWQHVDDPNRGTILAHGSFLSEGAELGDTSPVRRGYIVTTRLRCTPIPPPPASLMVDNAAPPSGTGCKADRYRAHRDNPTCASCHQHLDGVGMGLEGWDSFGTERTTEPDAPECSIDSVGQLPGASGTFHGPRQLSDQLVQSGELDACAVQQLYRFALGQYDVSAEHDTLGRWTDDFRASNHDFEKLLADIVASETFVRRRYPEDRP